MFGLEVCHLKSVCSDSPSQQGCGGDNGFLASIAHALFVGYAKLYGLLIFLKSLEFWEGVWDWVVAELLVLRLDEKLCHSMHESHKRHRRLPGLLLPGTGPKQLQAAYHRRSRYLSKLQRQ